MPEFNVDPVEVKMLRYRCDTLLFTLQAWLRKHDGRHVVLRLPTADRLRLLRLDTWSLRYKVPVTEILDIVIPILRKRAVKATEVQQRGYALGVRVSSLTGRAVQTMLEDQIRKRYIDHEHIGVWRSTVQAEQLAAERAEELEGLQPRAVKSVLNYETVEAFVSHYRRTVAAERETRVSKRARCMAYRGNPWR